MFERAKMLPYGNSVDHELQHYVESGQVDKARKTLNEVCCKRRLDIDQYEQLLLDAEQTGEISMIKLLLEYDPIYTEEFQDKKLSALWIAVLYGHQSSAELLVRSGSVDLNKPLGVEFRKIYDSKSTVLHGLVQLHPTSWNQGFIILVVDHGANFEARDSRGRTPLHYAVSKDQVKLTELLLEKGADVNAKDNEGETALLIAARSSKADELLTLLMRHGANVTANNSWGCNVLYNLTDAPGERVDLARALIEKGALINGCTDQHIYSSDPLRHAICLNKYELVKLYLDNGANNLRARDHKRRTILHCAVAQGQVLVSKLLLERGADVSVADDFGETPLLAAAESSNAGELLPLLMRHGADFTARNSRGCNVLCYLTKASDGEHVDLARVLIEKGVCVAMDGGGQDGCQYEHLRNAVFLNKDGLVRLYLENGADLKNRDLKGQTLLHIAVTRGHIQMTELLLEKGADVNSNDNEGKTPLLIAARTSKVGELLPLLMRHGADVTAKDLQGCNVLYHLTNAPGERIDLARVLIEKGVDLKNRDSQGQTILHCAATRGHVQMTELLLEEGADVNAKNNKGETPLLMAARSSEVGALLPLLMRHGADVTAKDAQGCNVLYNLIKNFEQRVDLARVLVEKGVDLENQDPRGQSVLHCAVTRGHVKMTELLLEKGANVDARDNEGKTPLLAAVRSGRANNEVLSLLMDYGADVRAKSSRGWNALQLLSCAPDAELRVDLARFLIEKGVPLNGRELSFRERPLVIAVRFHRNELVKLFLGHIGLNDRDLLGRTLLHCAVRQKNVEMIELLLEEGADINTRDNEGETPLLAATEFDYLEVLKTLLEHGANIDLRTNNGRTALHYACEKSRLYTIGMLLQAGADMLVEDQGGKTPFALTNDNNIENSCIRLMLEKLALIRACQPSIELKDEKIIERQPELRGYYQDCFKEIVKMKSMSLTDTCSVFELLAKSHCEISKHMRNREFWTNFKLLDLGVLCAYKDQHIFQAFERAECHHRSWLKQQDVINEAVFYILPDVVVRKVLRYIFYDCCRSVK